MVFLQKRWKNLAGALGVTIFMIALIIMVVPLQAYKPWVEKKISSALGLEFSVKGKLSLGFFPRVQCQMEKVALRFPGDTEPMPPLEIDRLAVTIDWLHFLRSHQFRVTHINVDKAVFSLPSTRVRQLELFDEWWQHHKAIAHHDNWRVTASKETAHDSPSDPNKTYLHNKYWMVMDGAVIDIHDSSFAYQSTVLDNVEFHMAWPKDEDKSGTIALKGDFSTKAGYQDAAPRVSHYIDLKVGLNHWRWLDGNWTHPLLLNIELLDKSQVPVLSGTIPIEKKGEQWSSALALRHHQGGPITAVCHYDPKKTLLLCEGDHTLELSRWVKELSPQMVALNHHFVLELRNNHPFLHGRLTSGDQRVAITNDLWDYAMGHLNLRNFLTMPRVVPALAIEKFECDYRYYPENQRLDIMNTVLRHSFGSIDFQGWLHLQKVPGVEMNVLLHFDQRVDVPWPDTVPIRVTGTWPHLSWNIKEKELASHYLNSLLKQ